MIEGMSLSGHPLIINKMSCLMLALVQYIHVGSSPVFTSVGSSPVFTSVGLSQI